MLNFKGKAPARPSGFTVNTRAGSPSAGVPMTATRSMAFPSTAPRLAQATYNIATEVLPAHNFFDPNVSKAIQTADKALESLQRSLQKATLDFPQDANLAALNARATAMSSRLTAQITRRVAIVGDSGQGKSSLVNSLLHMPGVAQTSDMGSACTSVVVEYHQKGEFQTSPIELTAEFYAGAALEELVRELTWSYRQLFLPDVNKDDMSERDYAKFEKESEEAWQALNSAFQHHKGFSIAILKDFSEGATERINDQLIQWAHAIQWPKGTVTQLGASTLWRSQAMDANECCRMTASFMSDGLWPFTKIIKVYLCSPLLNTGLILADLPGLHDTNLARVKATQDYLLKCDKILIVTKIARAITDQSVRSTLFSAVSRHVPMEWEESGGKNLKLAIVCTGAEDINIKTATAEFCGDGKRVPQQELQRLEAGINAAKGMGDYANTKAAKDRLKFTLVAARNAHVTEGLQKRYASETGGHLDVFCIGNHAYEKYCRHGIESLVRASGIPRLRRHCFTITADDRLLDARNWAHSAVPGLLNSAELWATSKIEGSFGGWDKARIMQNFEAIRARAPDHAEKLRKAFITCFREDVMKICFGQAEAWAAEASSKSKEWGAWPWNSYRAWCRRNGNHNTHSRGAVNWNADMAWKMRSELAFGWDIVSEEITSVYNQAADDFTADLARFRDETIMKISAVEQRNLLLASIRTTNMGWQYSIHRESQLLNLNLVHIKNLASEANESSYIVREMLPSYRTATADSGTGIFRRQKACIEGHITNGGLFQKVAMNLSDDVEKLAWDAADKVAVLVGQTLEKLAGDIELTLKDAGPGPVEASVRDVKTEVLVLKCELAGIAKF